MKASAYAVQVSLRSRSESNTIAAIQPDQRAAPGSSGLSISDLIARDVGSVAAAVLQPDTAPTDMDQHAFYHTQWQVAAPLLRSTCLRRQPLLAAVTVGGLVQPVVAPLTRTLHVSHTAQLLQALQCGATLGLKAAKQWILTSSMPAAASLAPAGYRDQLGCASAAAQLHSMLKVAAAERLIDADASVVYSGGYQTASIPTAAGGNRHFGAAIHAAAAYAPILQPSSALASASTPQHPVWSESAPHTIVVTGGLGGLGLLTACHLSEQEDGGMQLLLLGRSGRSSSAAADGQGIGAFTWGSGKACQVSMRRCDVGVADEAAGAVAVGRLAHPLRALLHAGGILEDASLRNQSVSKLQRVAAPKLVGLRHLALATAQCPLQSQVLYSSLSAELGTAGQGNYAAANAGLDAYATGQQQQGSTTISVQWGAWAGAGMAAATPALLNKLAQQGYAAVQPAAGLRCISQLIAAGSTTGSVLMAAPFHWHRFLASSRRGGLPYFAEVLPSGLQATEKHIAAPAAYSLEQVPAAVSSEGVLEIVQQLLADLAGASGGAVCAADVPFLESGLDSIGAVELRCAPARSVGSI